MLSFSVVNDTLRLDNLLVAKGPKGCKLIGQMLEMKNFYKINIKIGVIKSVDFFGVNFVEEGNIYSWKNYSQSERRNVLYIM